MAQTVSNCPRCGAQKTTFDVMADSLIDSYIQRNYGNMVQFHLVEAFCKCRACHNGTIFQLEVNGHLFDPKKASLTGFKDSIDEFSSRRGFVSIKDQVSRKAPEHVPPDIEAAFNEGAVCMAVGCFNAGGTMFRLCVDMVTVGLLPPSGSPSPPGPNYKQRRDLGLRLQWLFNNGLLPEALHNLAKCVQEDGNDSAHRGTLTKADSEDLLDFTEALLERLYTEPKRIELAQARRDARRAPP